MISSIGKSKPGGGRKSNIELLRIIAMAMVLIVHANFWSLGAPTIEEYQINPLGFGFRNLFEALAIGCVDIFILISGYFGIRPKLRSFCSFVFQCLFFLISIYLIAILTGLSDITLKGIMECFCLTPINWFIKAYIGLYIIAPVLNSFVDNADRKQHLNVIIAFYVFQTIYGCTGAAQFFDGGYGTLSFIGLYLLARFIKLYPNVLTEKPRHVYLIVYFLSAFSLMALQYIPILFGFSIPWLSDFNYINPVVLLSSVSILLYFSKLNFQSKAINWVAASSFAVFLIHSNPNINEKIFKETCIAIYQDYNGVVCIILFAAFLLVIYSAAILYDQVRKLMWNIVDNKLFKQ